MLGSMVAGLVLVFNQNSLTLSNIKGVWATEDGKTVWSFDRDSVGRGVKQDSFLNAACREAPNGEIYGWWARSSFPGEPLTWNGENTFLIKSDRQSSPSYLLSPVGTWRLSGLRWDAKNKPVECRLSIANGTDQVPSVTETVSKVCGLDAVGYATTYSSSESGVSLGRSNNKPVLSVGSKIYLVQYDGAGVILKFEIGDELTGLKVGDGALSWHPSPKVIKLLRAGESVAADQILVSFEIYGSRKRMVVLSASN